MLRVIFVKSAQPSITNNKSGRNRIKLLSPSGRNNKTQAHKHEQMGLEETNGPKGPGKREMTPMGNVWYEKVRMGRGRPEAM